MWRNNCCSSLLNLASVALLSGITHAEETPVPAENRRGSRVTEFIVVFTDIPAQDSDGLEKLEDAAVAGKAMYHIGAPLAYASIAVSQFWRDPYDITTGKIIGEIAAGGSGLVLVQSGLIINRMAMRKAARLAGESSRLEIELQRTRSNFIGAELAVVGALAFSTAAVPMALSTERWTGIPFSLASVGCLVVRDILATRCTKSSVAAIRTARGKKQDVKVSLAPAVSSRMGRGVVLCVNW